MTLLENFFEGLTHNQRADIIKHIANESPDLVTDDPVQHATNLMLYGTSIFFERTKAPAPMYGKSIAEVLKNANGK